MEICNGTDDDCDGTVDESGALGCVDYWYDGDLDGYGTEKKPKKCLCNPDADLNYTAEKPGDCNDSLPEVNPDGTERCNALDDDCDGQTDEDLGSTTCGLGECRVTVQNCVAGVPQTCVPGTPETETCNGLDDDCDGQTDEDLGSTTCGLGECRVTVQNCVAGVPQTCVPGTPETETCNGLDDDCDGQTDEDLGSTTCGLGECRVTVQNCIAGVPQTCVPGTPGTETCNGLDDDCDGLTDEEVCEVGCSDGEREGFLDRKTYPRIAGCSGGWSIPGVLGSTLSPACGRQAGDDSSNPNGNGCNVADLCAVGWHVCSTASDVAANSPTGCAGAAPVSGLFFATRQSSTGCGVCATGSAVGGSCNSWSCIAGCQQTDDISNDLFGCGSLGAIPQSVCSPLDHFSGNLCDALGFPWSCGSDGYREAYNAVKGSPSGGGVLCCKD